MKKIVLSLMAFFAINMCIHAQQTLDTYSTYDVDQDTRVTVQDVTKVVDRAVKVEANDKQMVDAEQLNAVLQAIDEKLQKLESLERTLSSLTARLGVPSLDKNPHEPIDLGLSVKWASCNLGAAAPEDFGVYLAWGEIQEKTKYYWGLYLWCEGSSDTQTKYCSNSSRGTVDYRYTLLPEDDAACIRWGGEWRIPTWTEMQELMEQCTWTKTTVNDVFGYQVTGSNGNSIFLPAAGYKNEEGLIGYEEEGRYWTSSLYEEDSYGAYYLYFNEEEFDWEYTRPYGFSIRPVCP